MESDLVYIGIVSSFSEKNLFLVLKDIPPDFPEMNQGIEAYIGFTTNFLEKIRITKIENRKSTIQVYLESNTSYNLEKYLRMGVYIERKAIEQIKSDYYGPEDLLDALVYDKDDKLIGRVVDVHILPTQFVIYVDSDTYIVPLPFSEHILIDFKLKEKIIKLDLPDNYLDIAELKG